MWQPFREPVFRALWIAAFFSNVGSLMQDVAAAWLMTSLTSQPLMVALLQTAVNLPFFVLALLAGALADVIDRRKLLIIGMAWMTIAALGLGCITLAGMASPAWLLAFTLFMGFGAAITSPAWNALIPELVPKERLEQAIALNSVGYNTARGLGSATGGILVATSGPGFVFMLNAFSFFGIIGVLLWWKRPTQMETQGTREPLLSAMRAGMRFARHSPGLRAVFAKTSLWAACTAAMWSLIPLIARQKLGLDSTQYGLLLSAFGGGTLVGATLLPRLRARVSLETTSRFGILLWAVASILMSYSVNYWLTMVYMAAFGAAWVTVNSCLNIGAQLAVPSWVRARALALYVLIFQGCVGLGSILWGKVGDYTGLSVPLLSAGIILLFGLVLGSRYHLGVVENLDTTQSGHWADPDIVYQPLPHHGPVLVTVEYSIDPARAIDFNKAMAQLGVQRQRDGAFQWHVFCDLSKPSRYIESYMVETWGEHVRQHERVMNADIEVEERVDAFQDSETEIVVRHYISAFAVDMPNQTSELRH